MSIRLIRVKDLVQRQYSRQSLLITNPNRLQTKSRIHYSISLTHSGYTSDRLASPIPTWKSGHGLQPVLRISGVLEESLKRGVAINAEKKITLLRAGMVVGSRNARTIIMLSIQSLQLTTSMFCV